MCEKVEQCHQFAENPQLMMVHRFNAIAKSNEDAKEKFMLHAGSEIPSCKFLHHANLLDLLDPSKKKMTINF